MRDFCVTNVEGPLVDIIDSLQFESVRLERNGQEVAYMLSPEEFHRLTEAVAPRGNPAVAKLHAESAERWAKVYEALAK